jgi:hypothetical protein
MKCEIDHRLNSMKDVVYIIFSGDSIYSIILIDFESSTRRMSIYWLLPVLIMSLRVHNNFPSNSQRKLWSTEKAMAECRSTIRTRQSMRDVCWIGMAFIRLRKLNSLSVFAHRQTRLVKRSFHHKQLHDNREEFSPIPEDKQSRWRRERRDSRQQ